MIMAAFTNVPVLVNGQPDRSVGTANVIETITFPPGWDFDAALDAIDAFSLDLSFRADEEPSCLEYRGVIVVETFSDGDIVVRSAGRNLM